MELLKTGLLSKLAKNDCGAIGWELGNWPAGVVEQKGSGTLLKSATKSVEKLFVLIGVALFVNDCFWLVGAVASVVDVLEFGTRGMLLVDCDLGCATVF